MSRPNILYIMTDDHAAHAMTCYGSRVNETPNMDRIADEGMRLDTCLCTNSICAPSRATILTGLYSHRPGNGVLTLDEAFDGRNRTFPQMLQGAGYQTALVGKWHLGHGGVNDPTGFDYWNVLPGQGLYHNPKMFDMGEEKVLPGYVTDLITDFSLEWLENRDRDRPFCLLTHHKAPHRRWHPDEKHAAMFADREIPEPPTFNDDYSNRSQAAAYAKMRIDRDLDEEDTKGPPPEGLTPHEVKQWKYQRYMKDYLACVQSVDTNMGRMLEYLDETGLTENTVVIYTSDQGFFLGDHNWYDKRFFYEESLRMPFVVRYPKEIEPGSTSDAMVLNTDFAPLILDYAGVPVPDDMDGRSFRSVLAGDTPSDWREIMYYRYFMHLSHHGVCAHYGVRTDRYKLIHYYLDDPLPPEWELFDLETDPMEMRNIICDPAYADVVNHLKSELTRLQTELGDTDTVWDKAPPAP